ncbi:MAG: hypothetical protein ACI4F3_12120 [Enterocloster sp.]
MNKKNKCIVPLIIFLIIIISIPVSAMPYCPGSETSVNEYSELLSSGVKQSEGSESSVARGDMFSSADIIITDEGNGNIGALAVAYTREPVDEAYITVFLDRWNEEEERWINIQSYEAEFYAEDYPDGLTTPTVDITFLNQERGYYYRLRGSFSVVKGDIYEGFSPKTNGILIE